MRASPPSNRTGCRPARTPRSRADLVMECLVERSGREFEVKDARGARLQRRPPAVLDVNFLSRKIAAMQTMSCCADPSASGGQFVAENDAITHTVSPTLRREKAQSTRRILEILIKVGRAGSAPAT